MILKTERHSRLTLNKGSGPQFKGTVYISEVNGARAIRSNAQIAMNTVQEFFLGVAEKDSAPKLLELSETSPGIASSAVLHFRSCLFQQHVAGKGRTGNAGPQLIK